MWPVATPFQAPRSLSGFNSIQTIEKKEEYFYNPGINIDAIMRLIISLANSKYYLNMDRDPKSLALLFHILTGDIVLEGDHPFDHTVGGDLNDTDGYRIGDLVVMGGGR